jgi:hypothetical protein
LRGSQYGIEKRRAISKFVDSNAARFSIPLARRAAGAVQDGERRRREKGRLGATFEGDCGRRYKYMLKMEGCQVGKVVMFKGTVDLGPRDGDVFD